MSALTLRYAHAFASVAASNHLDSAAAQQQLRDFSETFAGSHELREVLMNHLIDRPLSSSELVQLRSAATLYGGHKLSIVKGADGKPVIQKTAKVIRPNLWASNGMVQVIDHFLIPAGL